ncbi:MAG: toxin-antitoxin system protein [Chloroflexi bacterium]|nr:toxin-antitoxin system protein [Chloroflexota bacterium]
MSNTVRVTPTTYRALKDLSAESGDSMQAVMENALDVYQRQQMMERLNAAFARLRADEAAWQEELEERQEWDAHPLAINMLHR